MDDGDDMDVSIDGVTSKRACDSCRNRKIRCDRSVPCSNCKASKLHCTTTAPAQKAQRQRVHISEEYEKKIDRIEDRLAGIENVLASLATRLGDLDLRKDDSNQSRSSRTGAGRSPGALADAATPAPFEGETAINSQSTHARELLAQVVGSNPMIGENAEVRSALDALNDMVKRQGNISTNISNGNPALINRTLAEINPENLECPPLDEIMLVVESAAQYPTMAFAIIFPFLKMKSLRDIIEDVQSNPRTCGATRRLLAFGMLHSLFSEFQTFPLPGMDAENYRTYVVQCKIQIEVAMSQLDIFMPATYENIMALLLGSACAVEMCKPSACWVMISVAASLCQNIGYHRYQTMKDDTEEVQKSKIHMFWMIYMFDKTMSLRMGRASVIQDWDISLPFVTDSGATGDAGRDGNNMLAYWIKVARVQGQTYEKLFSPAAFLRSPGDRTRTAVELVNGMNQAWYERGSATAADISSTIAAANIGMQRPVHKNMSPNDTELPSTRRANGAASFGSTPQISEQRRKSLERIQDVFFYADVVMHYSTCALIQRAVSPDNVTFNQECLESSRAALVAHMRCNAQFNTKGNEELWTGYIHWSILQAPFTPFIVIFCNAIQNVDATDLPSLSDFVTSLESSRTLSEGADNLYKMCQLFLTVAKLYLQSKTQEVQRGTETFTTPPPNYYTATDGTQIDMSSITQFDPYLSALGLMPNSAWPMAGFTGAEATPGLDTFPSNGDVAGLTGFDPAGIGLAGGNNPNSVQDWFSGSRYLMNLMEAGEDFNMPDLNY